LINPRARIIVPAALASLLALTALPAAGSESDQGESQLGKINHIVVIYQENHSFDNLYGGWEGVNGLASADAAHTLQVKQNGTVFACLMQNDVNLTSPPLAADCTDTTGTPANTPFASHFANAPFGIEAFIPSSARTCPQPGVFAPRGLSPSPANLPAWGRPSEIRDRRQLLRGGVWRVVHQPPVADRGRDPELARCAGRQSFDHRLERNADVVSALHSVRSGSRPSADGRLPVASGGSRVRRLRGQHDPIDLPTTWRRGDTAAADGQDNRR
jgi:hypothetical protein